RPKSPRSGRAFERTGVGISAVRAAIEPTASAARSAYRDEREGRPLARRRRDMLEDATLVAATITMGLMAGVFGLYAHTIMPGLARTDDRTFVEAFQSIDRTII